METYTYQFKKENSEQYTDPGTVEANSEQDVIERLFGSNVAKTFKYETYCIPFGKRYTNDSLTILIYSKAAKEGYHRWSSKMAALPTTELRENRLPAFTNDEKPEPENMTREKVSIMAFRAVYADKIKIEGSNAE